MKIDEKVYRTIWPITGADSPKNDAGFSVQIIDQTMLPHRFEVKELAHLDEMIVAIKTMQVRGAPLIWCSGGLWDGTCSARKRE